MKGCQVVRNVSYSAVLGANGLFKRWKRLKSDDRRKSEVGDRVSDVGKFSRQ